MKYRIVETIRGDFEIQVKYKWFPFFWDGIYTRIFYSTVGNAEKAIEYDKHVRSYKPKIIKEL